MAFRNFFKLGFALASACALAQPIAPPQRVVNVDRVVAVVNDEAITQYDLDDAKRIVLQQLKQQNDTFGVVEIVLGKDRKSTRLNSSHVEISYAVFCLKKKKKKETNQKST